MSRTILLIFCAALFIAGGLGTWYQQDLCSRLQLSKQNPDPNITEHRVGNSKQTKGSAPPKKQVSAAPSSLSNTDASPIDQKHPQQLIEHPKKNWTETFICEAKATDVAIGWFTLFLVILTAGLINIGINQESHLADTARKELRSYVAVDNIFFNQVVSVITTWDRDAPVRKEQLVVEPNNLRIQVRNYGQTPACRVTVRCKCFKNPPGLREPLKLSDRLIDEHDLHPNQSVEWFVPTYPDFSSQYVGFYVVGQLVYQDIYGNWWVSDFCRQYVGENLFTPYGDKNRERGPFNNCPE